MEKTAAVIKSFTVLVFMLALCVANVPNVQATMISTAPLSYGTASHSDASWQRLGSSNTSNDGVTWSINGGAYGHDTIIAGQTVTLKFDMYKYEWGRHNYDALKVWIDKNQNGNFLDAGEMVFSDQWNFFSDPRNTHDDRVANLWTSFYYTLTVPTLANGDYWLRARVACNESIHNNLDNLTPYGNIWQGEVEDWKVTVAPVPEPSTLLLMGLGLGGVAFMRRKFKK